MAITTDPNGRKVVTFGRGDICIQDTRDADSDVYNGLCFFEMQEPRKIDAETDEFRGMTIDDVNAQVHFIFEKKESVMALIHSLETIYAHMIEQDE